MKSKKDNFMGVLFVLSLLLASVLAARESGAQAKPKPQAIRTLDHPIPIVGKTADGKYPIYQLKGELDDFNWFSGSIVYAPADLLGNMVFVDINDIKKGGEYVCEYVCKDKAGNIVGMNPAYRAMAGK